MGSATRGHCGNRSYPLRNQLERKQLCMIVSDSVSERALTSWCGIENRIPDTEPGAGYRTWYRIQNLVPDTEPRTGYRT